MRRLLALPAVAAALLLAGCAPTVSLRPAPEATSTRCAGVIVRMPDTIGTASRRATDAQGTAAWGLPASVTLTCGVLTPEVTGTPCQTIDGIDWLLQEKRIGSDRWGVLTTYGRDPGIQVLVNTADLTPDAALRVLSDAIATQTRTTRTCLAITDPAA